MKRTLEKEHMLLAKAHERFFIECQKEVAKMLKEIETSPLEGVNASGRSAEVSASAVKQNGGILTPSYYLPMRQAEAVEAKLQKADCSEKLFSAIRQILEKRKIGSVPMNPNTIRAISDSPIGRIASMVGSATD